MRMTARKTIMMVLGLLMAAAVPYAGPAAVQADPGCGCHAGKDHGGGCVHPEGCGPGCPHHGECPGCPGCGCECGYPKGAGQAVPPCMQDNAAGGPGGMHRMMHGGKDAPPVKEQMGKHLEAMKSTIRKLRELEAKMESLKAKDDAAAFRTASLEHAKLLTDLQQSHLKHMEGMMGGGK